MFNLASRISPSQLFSGIRISNIKELQFRLRRYFRRYIEECEDEAIREE